METPKKRLSIIVPEDMQKWLKLESEMRGISVNALVNYILSEERKKAAKKTR